TSGGDHPGIDFGNFRLASILGQKFEDSNGNNARDPGEPTLSGWVVFLDNDANGQPSAGDAVATTDAGGNFRFDNLPPGTYRVREVAQAGWLQSTARLDIVPQSGQTVTAADVGNFRLATIKGVLFTDANGNGVQDGPADPGLGAATVFLDTNNNGTPDN